ncbi:MAG TPA: IS200/IS605 family transposase [Cryomorphaceae bacterium]|nr:IS200/IS605 family transposase [Cryomorphaceae bacterium]
MGQSLVQNYLHIVFSTKHREPFIKKQFAQKLNKYIAVVSADLGSPALAVGGHVDHIHILVRLSQKMALMEYLQKIKSNSSRWMKTIDYSLENFRWQDGYAAFSVCEAGLENVKKYVLNQEEHHAKQGYREEITSLLEDHGVEYDERYFWD